MMAAVVGGTTAPVVSQELFEIQVTQRIQRTVAWYVDIPIALLQDQTVDVESTVAQCVHPHCFDTGSDSGAPRCAIHGLAVALIPDQTVDVECTFAQHTTKQMLHSALPAQLLFMYAQERRHGHDRDPRVLPETRCGRCHARQVTQRAEKYFDVL